MPPTRLYPELRHRYLGSLLAVLASALVVPALATGTTPKPPAVPACSHFPLTKLAAAIHVKALERLPSPVTIVCSYKGAIPGHYSVLLQIEVVPGTEDLFAKAEADAEKSSKQQHAKFFLVKSGRPAIFYVDGTVTGSSLPHCSLGWKLPTFGPPRCREEPDWTKISVYEYAPAKPTGVRLFVSVAEAGEEGTVFASELMAICTAILSGQIR